MPFLTLIEILICNSKKILIGISGLSGLKSRPFSFFTANISTNDSKDWLTEDGTKFLS